MYERCCSFWHSNLISHVCSFLSVLSIVSCSIIYLIHFGPIQFCLFVQLSAMGQVSGLFPISIGCGINYPPANTSPSQQLSCHYFMRNISWDFTMTPNSSSVGGKKKKKKKRQIYSPSHHDKLSRGGDADILRDDHEQCGSSCSRGASTGIGLPSVENSIDCI